MKETKHITLKKNAALNELSNYVGRTIEEVRSDIITCLLNYGYISDEHTYCGLPLHTILFDHKITVKQFSDRCFRKSYERLLIILKGIVIWGLSSDCPDCGCKTIIEESEMSCVSCNFSIGIAPENEKMIYYFPIYFN